VTPREYGEHLASLEPPITDAQVQAAARMIAAEQHLDQDRGRHAA